MKNRESEKPVAPEQAKTKLTYGERLEMKELEKDLGKLENQKKEIAAQFEGASLNADRLEELSREMKALAEELEEKEMRWLELSEYAQ
ncbi:MAG: ABC transporter C-terminal domain-containing protein [Owenweeksia sp.]|nr:ABC transporter C-terminal domain-containing protein [Owenweeksia sp.]